MRWDKRGQVCWNEKRGKKVKDEPRTDLTKVYRDILEEDLKDANTAVETDDINFGMFSLIERIFVFQAGGIAKC